MGNVNENEKERLARHYESHHAGGNRYGFVFGDTSRAQRFTRWVGTGKRLLDLGCRDGSLTQFYVGGNDVVGCDIDREALRRCGEKLGIPTQWLDLNERFPFEDASFDVVTAGEILEHVYRPEEFLSEIGRVLRPGGIFIGSVPNAFHLKHRLQFLMGREFEGDPTHLRKFNPRILKETLNKNGFVVEETVGVGGRLLPIFPMGFARLLIRLRPSLFSRTILFRARRA